MFKGAFRIGERFISYDKREDTWHQEVVITTAKTSKSLKVWKQCASVLACISGLLVRAVYTT